VRGRALPPKGKTKRLPVQGLFLPPDRRLVSQRDLFRRIWGANLDRDSFSTCFGAHRAVPFAHSAAHAIGGGASTTARCSRRGTKRSRRPSPEPPALRASCGARGRENPRENSACSKDPTGGVANRPSRTHGRPPQARWRRPCARAGFPSPHRPCAAGWSRARPPAPRARPRDRAVTPGAAGRTECGWRWRPAFAARTDER